MWGSNRSTKSSLGAMAPALAVGLAAGVTGGVLAAGALDTTPYGRTDFYTASHNARQQGKTEALREAKKASAVVTTRLRDSSAKELADLRTAHEEQVAQLKNEATKTHRRALDDHKRTLAEHKRTLKSLQRESDKREARLAELQSSLAESTAALDNVTSQAVRGGDDRQAVRGTLESTWVLGSQAKPWPRDCAKPLGAYAVRVTAGVDVTVAAGSLVDVETTERTAKKGVLTLSCSMTYAAELPNPLGSTYRFVVVDSTGPGATRANEAVSGASLRAGEGPKLTVSQ